MKKLCILPILSLVLAAFTCNGSPRIEFDDLAHDFGRVPQRSIFKHVFTFRNTGTGTLIINDTKATCGCTSTVLSQKRVTAGNTGEIEVSFNSGYYEGKVTRAVFVYSNDSFKRYVRLTVKADVQPVEK